LKCVIPGTAPSAADGALVQALELPGGDAFARDVRFLSDLFAGITGVEALNVKLECFGGGLCERFHVDLVQLRLICSYGGPGTEWLEEAFVNRARLGPDAGGPADEESGLLLPGATVWRMDRFAVGLMKGERWPGNSGRGLVHRSPYGTTADVRRSLFKIDMA
jgi:hypothetical protein